MRDKKWRFELYSIWDHTGLEAHLARMAEEGWLLEKVSNFGWTYRRIAPQKLTFCVTYYPKASDFAPEISEEQKTFYAFCQHTGWELAASCAQLQVFYNERENPVPIETDPLLELDTIHRTMKRSALLSHFLLAVLALLQGGMFLSGLRRNLIGQLSSASSLFSGLCWVMVLLLTGSEIAAYYRWRAKARKAAERGEFLATNSRIPLQIACLVVVGLGLLWYFLSIFTSGNLVMMAIAPLMFLGMGLLLFLSHAIKNLLKRMKVSTNVNRIVTLVSIFGMSFALVGGITFGMLAGMQKGWFAGDRDTYRYRGSVFPIYRDELPLTVEDLTGQDYGDVYIREMHTSSSFLLAQYESRQHPRFDSENYRELPTLEYTVTLVKVPALYDICKKSLLAEYDGSDEYWANRKYVAQDAAPWGAAEAYRVVDQEFGPWDIYLLCYSDRIVEFRPDWELAPEQMALVGEKLGNS